MKKLFLFLVLLLIIGVVAVFLLSNVLLAMGLEAAIGAPAKVGKVDFDFGKGSVGIYSVVIKNPKGFQEPVLASMPELFVDINPADLLKGRIHVENLRINLDEVNVVKNEQGKVNLIQLGAVQSLLHEKKKEAPEEKKAPEPQQPEEKPSAGPLEVVIDEVHVSLGRARYIDYTGTDRNVREFGLNVKDRELRNLQDPRQVTSQIVFEVLKQVGLNALVPDWSQFGAAFETQVKEKLSEAKELLTGWTKKVSATS